MACPRTSAWLAPAPGTATADGSPQARKPAAAGGEPLITVDIQQCGPSVLVSASGELDGGAGDTLRQAPAAVTGDERELGGPARWRVHGRRRPAPPPGRGPACGAPEPEGAGHRLAAPISCAWPRSPASPGLARPPASGTPWRASAGSSRNGPSAHGTARTSPPDAAPRLTRWSGRGPARRAFCFLACAGRSACCPRRCGEPRLASPLPKRGRHVTPSGG